MIPWFLYLALEPDYWYQNLWTKDTTKKTTTMADVKDETEKQATKKLDHRPSSFWCWILRTTPFGLRGWESPSKLIKFGIRLISIFGIKENYWNQNLWAKDTTKNTWHIPSCNGANNTDYENYPSRKFYLYNDKVKHLKSLHTVSQSQDHLH